jgi:uncharacterized protein
MKRIRVVVDSNVVVSAHLSDKGYERYVVDLVLAGKLDLCVSAAFLAEYEGVLHRKKFGISPSKVLGSMRLMRKAARLVSPRVSVCAATDPEDNKFLECEVAANAEYLVTGDKRHFPKMWRGMRIVNARELMEWIVPELSG